MWRPNDYEMAGYELVKVTNEDGKILGYIISEAEQASIDEDIEPF